MKDLKKRAREILESYGGKPEKFKGFMCIRKWWEDNYPDIAGELFAIYDKCNEIYDVSIGKFLKSFVFDVDTRVCYDYSDIFTKRSTENINAIIKGTKPSYSEALRAKILKAKEICDERLGYETRSPHELKYCLINKIESLPVCQLCGGSVEYNGPAYGFRKFCSAKCQNTYHNSQKEVRRADLSDDEVRELILKEPIDSRNLHNEVVAGCFENVLEYTNNIFKPLKPNEALYIFLNKLTKDDIMCPVCEVRKRKFISQGQGYRDTCGCKTCQYGARFDIYYEGGYDPVAKGPYSIRGDIEYRESGFIYIIKSDFSGLTKIGISQDPVSRIKMISKDIEDVRLINCFYIKSGLINLEEHLHDMYRDNQVLLDPQIAGYTEWFKLSEDDVKDVEGFINGLHSEFEI